MSHFSVMVQIPSEVMENGDIGSYVEGVLEPYNENATVTAYIRHPKAEVLADYEKAKEKYPEHGYEEMSLSDFADAWYGQELDEEGNAISTYNPKSKWDWWTVGGRWSALLRLKNGDVADLSPVEEIDFDGIEEDNRQRRADAWDEAHKDGGIDGFRRVIYGIKTNSKEEHVLSATGLTTFAVITKDGEWCGKGEMGWWGVHDATEDEEQAWQDSYYHNFIKPLDSKDGIIIIDCHI